MIKIMNMIVENTNNYARQSRNESLPHTRINQWYPTCREELYLYFAIRIYMTLHIQNEILDYCSKGDFMPYHDIMDKMPRNRFQELHMRVRLVETDAIGPYVKVSKAPPYFINIFFVNY
jgi:hypothetical protein